MNEQTTKIERGEQGAKKARVRRAQINREKEKTVEEEREKAGQRKRGQTVHLIRQSDQVIPRNDRL